VREGGRERHLWNRRERLTELDIGELYQVDKEALQVIREGGREGRSNWCVLRKRGRHAQYLPISCLLPPSLPQALFLTTPATHSLARVSLPRSVATDDVVEALAQTHPSLPPSLPQALFLTTLGVLLLTTSLPPSLPSSFPPSGPLPHHPRHSFACACLPPSECCY